MDHKKYYFQLSGKQILINAKNFFFLNYELLLNQQIIL